MSASVDLRQLAVRRDGGAPVRPARRRGHLVARYLLPAKPVTVVPVLTSRAELRQEGTPLFQSAGWIEPRPTPILITALYEGVVEKLLVVEGQEVKAGEQ